MRNFGIENNESCGDFILRNPTFAEEIIKVWEKTYPIPSNAEVFEKILKETDCRYEIKGNKIYHNGSPIGKLNDEWAREEGEL